MAAIALKSWRPSLAVNATRLQKSVVTSTQYQYSSMAKETIPLVTIGRTSVVGREVEKNLKPEYEGLSLGSKHPN